MRTGVGGGLLAVDLRVSSGVEGPAVTLLYW